MEYVYHGSKTHGIKSMEPRPSTHGTYVYATESKAIAIVMSKRCGDDATYSFMRNKEGTYDLIERLPHAFDKSYSNDFSLYTLDATNFKDIKTGFNEVVSDKTEKVVKEEIFPSAMDAIKKLEEEGKIKIYRYPERPDYIPEDDMDLVEKVKYVHDKLGKMNDAFSFYRWIFLHPNIENEFRKLAKEYNIDLPWNYDEIKNFYVARQQDNPDHECYIDNAEEMYKLTHQEKKL